MQVRFLTSKVDAMITGFRAWNGQGLYALTVNPDYLVYIDDPEAGLTR